MKRSFAEVCRQLQGVGSLECTGWKCYIKNSCSLGCPYGFSANLGPFNERTWVRIGEGGCSQQIPHRPNRMSQLVLIAGIESLYQFEAYVAPIRALSYRRFHGLSVLLEAGAEVMKIASAMRHIATMCRQFSGGVLCNGPRSILQLAGDDSTSLPRMEKEEEKRELDDRKRGQLLYAPEHTDTACFRMTLS
ncbi:hypothetical protein N657DRAFT_118819 [Parathielavia appendiculata]|uniref:Uncharacterized protein n=1 Tax=Parathielavia appendiculata TaxID=2587402 RepID=A0AAN6TVA7_9PEZI|nr:hypothetical protein N657DRAFT_118819 [Parathielavia appendiculata]